MTEFNPEMVFIAEEASEAIKLLRDSAAEYRDEAVRLWDQITSFAFQEDNEGNWNEVLAGTAAWLQGSKTIRDRALLLSVNPKLTVFYDMEGPFGQELKTLALETVAEWEQTVKAFEEVDVEAMRIGFGE